MSMKRSSVFALCLGLSLAQGSLWADGVTRSLEPVPGGCKVTLSWVFSGKVESDLIIEERLARGWSVDDATVPFGSLDATWFPGSVARFAVKPNLLSRAGSISFVVRSADESASGTVSGDWQIYLGGTLRKGFVSGNALLSMSCDGPQDQPGGASDSPEETTVETPVAIASFKVLPGSGIELAYVGVKTSGMLVVEGCKGLGSPWAVVKGNVAVVPGDGVVTLTNKEVGGCCFYRIKLITEGE